MAPPARSGVEAHETERLRGRGVEDVPDVDAHPVEHDLELVDEGDVDGAKDVLDELRGLGLTGVATRTVRTTIWS